eukprot:359140-Chlamydomonas_euryale.AAC.1
MRSTAGRLNSQKARGHLDTCSTRKTPSSAAARMGPGWVPPPPRPPPRLQPEHTRLHCQPPGRLDQLDHRSDALIYARIATVPLRHAPCRSEPIDTRRAVPPRPPSPPYVRPAKSFRAWRIPTPSPNPRQREEVIQPLPP